MTRERARESELKMKERVFLIFSNWIDVREQKRNQKVSRILINYKL